MLHVCLLLIDPQNDFMDVGGSLGVPGATADMQRLAKFVNRIGNRVTKVAVTMDSHYQWHIANPLSWSDPNGVSPAPFTTITLKDVVDGKWTFRGDSDWGLDYVKALEAGGKYTLTIWPPHCLVGTSGHNVQPDLMQALHRWERGITGDRARLFLKGSNNLTEHYSAIRAEVVVPVGDPTDTNYDLISYVNDSDMIVLAGEALSHCMASTVRDLADKIGSANVSKLHLLRDCTSNVPGCDALGDAFLADLSARGMKVVNSDEFWPA